MGPAVLKLLTVSEQLYLVLGLKPLIVYIPGIGKDCGKEKRDGEQKSV